MGYSSAGCTESYWERADGRCYLMRLKDEVKGCGLPGSDGDWECSVAGGRRRRTTCRYVDGPAEAIQRLNGEIENRAGASFACFFSRRHSNGEIRRSLYGRSRQY